MLFVKTNLQIFTDCSNFDEKVAAAAVSSVAPNSLFSGRLRGSCSIYTAEVQAILFVFKQYINLKKVNSFFCTDSLSALQALEK